jgi:hypothetical protein
MKNKTRIFALVLACFFAAAAGFAQSADESFNNYRKLRNDKAATPSPAYSQMVCDAGTSFLAQYGADVGKARTVVNELLTYGTGTLAKDKALRADWYAKLSYAIVDKQHSADEKAKTAFAALAAAVAEGEIQDNPNGQAVTDWRAKIEALYSMPNGLSYTLDREKGFYNFMSKLKPAWAQKIVSAQLAQLTESKDRNTANWARQESKINELRKAPLTLAFTAFDGKPFDSTKLKGTPSLFIYFWSATPKNAAGEMEKAMDAYFEFGRRQVEFVAYCCDPEDKRADVQAFLKKAKVKFPVYFDGAGTKGELYQKLGVSGVPAGGYLFNGSGLLVDTNVRVGDLKKMIR